MNRKLLPFSLLTSTLLLLALFWLVSAARADLLAQETPLNQGDDGDAYEVNSDAQGRLWVSDNGAGEIRSFDPATGVYTTFLGLGMPSDARLDANGSLWWIDQEEGQLAQLNPHTNAYMRWDMPSRQLFGTAIDAENGVWITDFFHGRVYRFLPAASQLCTYTYATIGANDYILADGLTIWLADWVNDSLLRLDEPTGLLNSWKLPYNARPEGLALDAHGNLWWADVDRGEISRLEPGLDRVTVFDPPAGGTPFMLTASLDFIWYSDYTASQLGRLDPRQAAYTNPALETAQQTLTPACKIIQPESSGTITSLNDAILWTATSYTTTLDSGGWLVHQLPSDSYPWGISSLPGQIWFVANGRQVLGQVVEKPRLSACKLADADGSLLTTQDQTPVMGWTIYLLKDGIRQSPAHTTSSDGCTAWADLETGVSYGVEEELPASWQALTPVIHTFGMLQSGEIYSYNFINHQGFSIFLPLLRR